MVEAMEVPYDPLYPQHWYHMMCETTPFVLDEQTHSLRVFRYQDVQRILLDTKTFSSRIGLGRGITDMQRVRDIPLEPLLNSGAQGIKHFPITFKPGPRVTK